MIDAKSHAGETGQSKPWGRDHLNRIVVVTSPLHSLARIVSVIALNKKRDYFCGPDKALSRISPIGMHRCHPPVQILSVYSREKLFP
jgi:hypothetical protein